MIKSVFPLNRETDMNLALPLGLDLACELTDAMRCRLPRPV